MPAKQAGQIDGKPGAYRLRWYTADGGRRTKQPFKSKSDARTYYREVVEPALNGLVVVPELTLAQFVPVFLDRHAANVRPRTITALRESLAYALRAFGDVPLRELERMAGEVASWRSTLPERSRYNITAALRQCLGAAIRWGYITQNPAVLAGSNPLPSPRGIRAYSFEELDRIAAELSPMYRPLPMFAAATGLRPEEWQALERRDIDRQAGVLHVRRTVSSDEIVDLGKTSRSRRQVPLSPRALAALDALPPRLDVPLLFPSPDGRLLHLDNFRYREWSPAIEAGAVERPARIYDLRSTFASNALAGGISAFELAKVMGTSIKMIERHYGTLLDGAATGIAARLAAGEASLQQQEKIT